LFHLRTGHIALNKFLPRIDPAVSPLCPACRSAPESVHHFLAACNAYRPQRERLQMALRTTRAVDVNALLRGQKHVRPLLQYVHETGRFASSLGNL
ncbi:hypothetical protein CONPUDRAFT_28127, partial [Coniophora puteana RWD-64-598 SS2]